MVVGGGFAGIEVFAELPSLASSLVADYSSRSFDDMRFHLIEAMGRIMPKVSLATSQWVLGRLTNIGGECVSRHAGDECAGRQRHSLVQKDHLDHLIVWGAGVTANPTVVRRSDLPIEERGRIRARVGSADRHVEGAWAAGDIAAVAARPRVTEAAAGAADSSAAATAAQMTV